MLRSTSSAPSLMVTAGPAISDRRALSVADDDPGVGDRDHRAGRRLEQDPAGRSRHVADQQRVLLRASGSRPAGRRAARPARAPAPRRPIPRSSRPRSDSPGCPARTRSTPPSRSPGTAKRPAWMPANGRHGIAQVDGSTFDTSGTCTISRPICMRIDVVEDRAAVLAEILVFMVSLIGASVGERRHHRQVGDQRVALEDEALLVLAGLEAVGDAVDVVHSVERQPGAAHADEAARPQHLPVAHRRRACRRRSPRRRS